VEEKKKRKEKRKKEKKSALNTSFLGGFKQQTARKCTGMKNIAAWKG